MRILLLIFYFRPNNISFGDLTNIIVDSVILQYVIDDYYGNEIQTFSNLYVSKLTDPIYKDSSYYSNYPVTYSQSELVSLNHIVFSRLKFCINNQDFYR